jgi:predicted nuclease with TOPRIM domain
MTEPLSPERLAEIRDTDPGDWYRAPWTTEYVDSDGDEPDYYRVKSEGETIATLPDFAGPLALFIADAREAVPELLGEVDRLTAELAKYVGHEPTVAEEMQYLKGENDRLSSEVEQWRATFGADALPSALARLNHAESEVERLKAENAGLNDLRIRAIDKGDQLRARVDEVERAYTFDTAELRRRVAELERPEIERKRNEIRDSYQACIKQAADDRDFYGRDHVLLQLEAREAEWAAEDAKADAR